MDDTDCSSISRMLELDDASVQGQQRQGNVDQHTSPRPGRTINEYIHHFRPHHLLGCSLASKSVRQIHSCWHRYFHTVRSWSALLLAVYLGHILTNNICHSGRGILLDVSVPDCRNTSDSACYPFWQTVWRWRLRQHRRTWCLLLDIGPSDHNSLKQQPPQPVMLPEYIMNRGYNFRAHHQAKLALKIQSASFSYRCLNSVIDTCLNADIAAVSCIMQCKIVHKCCC